VAPMLLSAGPTPVFQTSRRMSLRELFEVSPLGCVGAFLLGGIFAAMFGMAAVYGGQAGLSIGQISALVAAIYMGGLVAQWPIGWLSDRMDRRRLIIAICAVGAVAAMVASVADFTGVLIAAAVVGAVANPLYSLIIAHTNDFLKADDMASASGGLLFLNGVGAVGGPIAVGFLMERFGAGAYFAYFAVLLAGVALYGLYRMTQRAAPLDTAPYAPILASATSVAVGMASEIAASAEKPLEQG